eukprot:TRINITY_DN27107_c0_g1_i1.p1 TRINITY_DN27107_c0_g1~~TRINITY_DN27107_c0_g1_i1.p1  ORF type:complete len:538 (+),score=90.27 TRINITY_DN27107_c0_g1_i1:45-1616(+)
MAESLPAPFAIDSEDEKSYLARKQWRYPDDARSKWLPHGAQERVDAHPWATCALAKNPRFPGYVPPEALFCWTEPDFSAYVSSGGFVKPQLKCQYYIAPDSPQDMADILDDHLHEMNWTCSVDDRVGREETTTAKTDYHGMPMVQFAKQPDGSSTMVKPSDKKAPIFIWEGSRPLVDRGPTLKNGGLANRIAGTDMFTKLGMLELVRERCIDRDIPVDFPPSWFPMTFGLPEDLEAWKRYAEEHPHIKWLYKPNGEAMSRGIVLVSKVSDIDTVEKPFRTRCRTGEVFSAAELAAADRRFASSGVLQEYVVDPLLLDNRRFVVRIYLLVARAKPFLAFSYNAGYVKRCGSSYDEHSFEQEDLFRHVTNQELHRKDEAKSVGGRAEVMSIEDLDTHLASEAGIPAFRLGFWDQVCQILMEVCLGMQEQVEEKGRPGMFEVFGLDVIVDANEQVYLLEANRDPSWAMDTEVKQAIIPAMIKEVLDLAFWAHSEEGHGREALLNAPMSGFEVLIDDAFGFRAVDVE